MLSSLIILIITAIYCSVLGLLPRWSGLVRWAALAGVGAALVVSLAREGLEGGGPLGAAVPWPSALGWLGAPIYRSDTLSAGLGAWGLLLGLLLLLRNGSAGAWGPVSNVALLATLYSLVHTDHLLAFAGQLLLLVALLLASSGPEPGDYGRGLAALGLGAMLLLGAVLLMGRTTGGAYSLNGLPLPALSVWPLLLVGGFVFLWLGMPPLTGWSARLADPSTAGGVLAQSLAIGMPPLVLLLRLQGLVSAQALAGSVPEGWAAFMGGLAWVGGVGALVGAAAMLVWAGSARWGALLTAHTMALSLWALCLDNPLGRLAALAIFLAYGAGRVALHLAGGASLPERFSLAASVVSLAAAPITPSFVGLWLLASLLLEGKHPALAVALAGAAILSAGGTVLHAATLSRRPAPSKLPVAWLAGGIGALLVLGGVAPGLWLPSVARLAAVGAVRPL